MLKGIIVTLRGYVLGEGAARWLQNARAHSPATPIVPRQQIPYRDSFGENRFAIKAGEPALIPGGDPVRVVELNLDESDHTWIPRTDGTEDIFCRADFSDLIAIPGDLIWARNTGGGWEIVSGGNSMVRGTLHEALTPTGTATVNITTWDADTSAWVDSGCSLQSVRAGLPMLNDIAAFKAVWVKAYSGKLLATLAEC